MDHIPSEPTNNENEAHEATYASPDSYLPPSYIADADDMFSDAILDEVEQEEQPRTLSRTDTFLDPDNEIFAPSQPSHTTTSPAVPPLNTSILAGPIAPLVDQHIGPGQLSDPIHTAAIPLVDQLLQGERVTIDCHQAFQVKAHSSSYTYYAEPKISLVSHNNVAHLLTSYQGKRHYLPVDQSRIRVFRHNSRPTLMISFGVEKDALTTPFLPFILNASRYPPSSSTVPTPRETTKEAGSLFLSPYLQLQTGIETIGDSSFAIHSSPAFSVVNECITAYKDTQKVLPLKYSLHMSSDSSPIASYLQAPALKTPHLPRPLCYFLATFSKELADKELMYRQRAAYFWGAYEITRGGNTYSNQLAPQLRNADNQSHFRAALEATRFGERALLGAFSNALHTALTMKAYIIKTMIGKAQPQSIFSPLKEEDPLLTCLWSKETLQKVCEALSLECEKNPTIREKLFARASGALCHPDGREVRPPFLQGKHNQQQAVTSKFAPPFRGRGRGYRGYIGFSQHRDSEPKTGHSQLPRGRGYRRGVYRGDKAQQGPSFAGSRKAPAENAPGNEYTSS